MKPYRRDRIDALRQTLRAKRIDALLITAPENRRYLSGYIARDTHIAESSGVLVVSQDKLILLTDSRYELQAREEAVGFDVVLVKRGLARTLGSILRRCGVCRLGVESHYLLLSTYKRLSRLSKLELVETKGIVEKLRSTKTEGEIARIEEAVRLNEEVFRRVKRILKAGVTERQVAWQIENLAREAGAEDVSFEPIVAAGPNAAKPHAGTTDRVIALREPIIVDMGILLNGYCSDMTRTLWLGKPSPQFKEVYRIVREAQLAAMDSLRAGLKARDADRTARDIISKAGYGHAFGHALGHGVGLAVHEAPTVSPLSKDTLESGMVVTVEPGIYIPGWGGVRLENMVAIEDERCRLLNRDTTFYDFSPSS